MKKVFFISVMLCCFIKTSIASSIVPETDRVQLITLNCKTIDDTVIHTGFHRTPPSIPIIYLNQENGSLLFETPCYSCTLELVVHDTNTIAFSYIIPLGCDVVQLPTYLSGAYELHIHRGIFCFYATIEL